MIENYSNWSEKCMTEAQKPELATSDSVNLKIGQLDYLILKGKETTIKKNLWDSKEQCQKPVEHCQIV